MAVFTVCKLGANDDAHLERKLSECRFCPLDGRVRDHLLYMEVGAHNGDTGNIASKGCRLSCCRFFPASDRFYPAAVWNFSPLRRECIFSSANLFSAAANVFSC